MKKQFLTLLITILSLMPHLLLAQTWVVTTIAGWEEDGKNMDGLGQKAHFSGTVKSSAIDANNNLYVIDEIVLRKVDAATHVTSLFGIGAMDANYNDLGLAALPGQDGICVDKDGNIYLASGRDHSIYKISADKKVERFAGDEGYKGKDDGNRLEAGFYNPTGLCIDKEGNIYVADSYNFTIRKISTTGKVTTLAGDGVGGDFKPGQGKNATLREPRAIAVDSKGNIYVAQNGGRGNCVAKITPAGVVSNFVGDFDGLRPAGANDGTGKAARFMRINALAVDKDDNLIIGENTRIRKATPSGVVTTIAGNETEDFRDAVGSKAMFRYVAGISIDNMGNIFVSDRFCIRKITKQ